MTFLAFRLSSLRAMLIGKGLNEPNLLILLASCSAAEVIIAEGCGDASLETDEIFDLLGLDWQQIPHLSADFRFEPLQGSLQTAAK